MGVLVPHEDVADGEDPDRVGLEQVVDLDAVLRVGVDAQGLEVQPLDVGQPSLRAEDLGRRDLAGLAGAAVLVVDDLPAVPGLAPS